MVCGIGTQRSGYFVFFVYYVTLSSGEQWWREKVFVSEISLKQNSKYRIWPLNYMVCATKKRHSNWEHRATKTVERTGKKKISHDDVYGKTRRRKKEKNWTQQCIKLHKFLHNNNFFRCSYNDHHNNNNDIVRTISLRTISECVDIEVKPTPTLLLCKWKIGVEKRFWVWFSAAQV